MSNGCESLQTIVEKTGYSKNTIKKYLANPNPQREDRDWRTRKNPFEDVWEEIKGMVSLNPGLEAKRLLAFLQEKYPGNFNLCHLRTLQRHIKTFKAQEGPAKEVMFEQTHLPGKLSASDFTHMDELMITINGVWFKHLLFHFVLTYSNWEWAYICQSESFEALRSGLKESLTRLGGCTEEHLTDSLSAAVHNLGEERGEFKRKYHELMDSFGMRPRATQPSCPNENGDAEARNYRLKKAVDQELMLRGSRNFNDIDAYKKFLFELLTKLNSTRLKLFKEDLQFLKPISKNVLPDYSQMEVKVSKFATIRVRSNTYSVLSSLIGQKVEARLYDDRIDIHYGQKKLLSFPRIRGKGKHRIDYRHVIESLRRKPGAFANYRYREEFFPSTNYRIAYDALKSQFGAQTADKQYLEILVLAATSGEDIVERTLVNLYKEDLICLDAVKRLLEKDLGAHNAIQDIIIDTPDLSMYDVAFGLEVA